MIPSCEIRLVTLQLKITISWIFDNFCWNWVWNFIQKIPPWEIWNITLQFQIKFSQFCAYFSLKLEWNFNEKRPSCEMTHNTSIPNQIFSICADFWLKLVWNFIQKIPPWDICYITLQFKIIISWVLRLFLAEISMKFHSNDTSLRNMTCNSSIQNHNFMNFCLLLVEIKYETSFKRYLLEKCDT